MNFEGDKSDGHTDIIITKRITDDFSKKKGLKKYLNFKNLWLIGMGAMLTGVFSHWNIGLSEAGPLGFLIAMILTAVVYITFIMVMSELSVHLPYAGGPYACARLAFGKIGGYLAGVATLLQFICASAIIVKIMTKYYILIFSEESVIAFAVLIFLFLLVIHLLEIRIFAVVQNIIVFCALSLIVLFFLGTSDVINDFNFFNLFAQPFRLEDVGSALPYAVWMFFGLEVISVAAEETNNSEKNISVSLILGVITTVIICFTILYFVIAAYKKGIVIEGKFPLLNLINTVQSQDRVLLATFTTLGLSTFFASLNGFIYGYSRQIYSLSRAGYLPHFLSKLHPVLQTPYLSIIIPGVFVVIMAYISTYQFLFVFTVFSAVIMYMLVIISFFRIHKYESLFFRQKKFYYPSVITVFAAIVLSLILFVIILNYFFICLKIFLIWFFLILYYYIWAQNRIQLEAPEESRAISARVKMRIELK